MLEETVGGKKSARVEVFCSAAQTVCERVSCRIPNALRVPSPISTAAYDLTRNYTWGSRKGQDLFAIYFHSPSLGDVCHAAGQPSDLGTASTSCEALYATGASDICN